MIIMGSEGVPEWEVERTSSREVLTAGSAGRADAVEDPLAAAAAVGGAGVRSASRGPAPFGNAAGRDFGVLEGAVAGPCVPWIHRTSCVEEWAGLVVPAFHWFLGQEERRLEGCISENLLV